MIWYQVIPDRFIPDARMKDGVCETRSAWDSLQGKANSVGQDILPGLDTRYSGTLESLALGVPYFQSFGVMGLCLTPIFPALSPDGHDPLSWHHVHPCLSSSPESPVSNSEIPALSATWEWTAADRALRSLIDTMHRSGIRVILEAQFVHVSKDFWAFRDLWTRQAGSMYRSWFSVSSFRDSSQAHSSEFLYQGMWGRPDLPRLNLDSVESAQGLKEYLFASTRRWMDPNGDGNCSDGVDGWKVDLSWEMPRPLLEEWTAFVKSVNRDAVIVLVAPDLSRQARDKVADVEYTPIFFDAVMSFIAQGSALPTYFSRLMMELDIAGDPNAVDATWNWFSSPETERWRTICENVVRNRESSSSPNGVSNELVAREVLSLQKLMMLVQYSLPGSPLLFYGDELGMPGGDDPDSRRPMPRFVAASENHPLFQWAQTLAEWRNRFLCLRFGNLRTLLIDDKKRLFGFMRQAGISRVYVFINADHQPQEARMTMPGVPEGARITDLVSGLSFFYQKNGLVLTLPPRSGTLFVSSL